MHGKWLHLSCLGCSLLCTLPLLQSSAFCTRGGLGALLRLALLLLICLLLLLLLLLPVLLGCSLAFGRQLATR